MISLEWVLEACELLDGTWGATLGPDGNIPYEVSLEEAQSWQQSDCYLNILPQFLLCVASDPEKFVEFLFSIGRISDETYRHVLARITMEMAE